MILDAVERFFNAQSDLDWAWWPALRLRPPQDVNFRVSFFLSVFLAEFVFFGTVLIGCVAALNGLDAGVTLAFFSSPLGVALLAGDLVFSFVTSSPYYFFWNRRAARLRQTPRAVQEEIVRPDVWPPPPRVPR